MRLFLLVVLVLINFSGNSLLTRAGVTLGGLGAVEFAVIRLGSGAAMLGLLMALRGGGIHFASRLRVMGVLSLLLYLFAFSVAYLGMDSGIGALILFGMVQVTMFAGGLIAREAMPARRWIGAGLAMAGLAWLLWPAGTVVVGLGPGVLMALGGIGWGLYSLAGRGEPDALAGTAANFIAAAVLVGAVWALAALAGSGWARSLVSAPPLTGVVLAVISGAITSGLGYALWYTVLPQLDRTVAAVAQLTVPVIVTLGGMLWLGESLSLRFVLAAVLVLGGIAISVVQRGRSRSSGS